MLWSCCVVVVKLLCCKVVVLWLWSCCVVAKLCERWPLCATIWQDSLWNSQSEWQRIQINGESRSMVWPTLGPRKAKEQNRIVEVVQNTTSLGILRKLGAAYRSLVDGSFESPCRVLVKRNWTSFLWSPYVIGRPYIFMAALCNRGPLYFCPVISIYLSSIFFFLA